MGGIFFLYPNALRELKWAIATACPEIALAWVYIAKAYQLE